MKNVTVEDIERLLKASNVAIDKYLPEKEVKKLVFSLPVLRGTVRILETFEKKEADVMVEIARIASSELPLREKIEQIITSIYMACYFILPTDETAGLLASLPELDNIMDVIRSAYKSKNKKKEIKK